MSELLRRATAPIVMLVRALAGGGAQRDAIELANGLHRAGWPIVVATLDAAGPLRTMIAPGMTLIDLGQGRKRRMAFAAPALAGMMTDMRPAAVIASEVSANILLVLASRLLARRNRPAIMLREVASPRQARRADPYWQNRLAYRLAPLVYPRADRVLTFTEATRRDLIGHFRVAPDRAINLGTNAVLTKARLTTLAQPGPRQPGLVVAIGRLSPEKDFVTLLAAFAVLREERALRLLILGEGPERGRLERRIVALGLKSCVDLAGFVPDPTLWLRRAALFVSTSRHEGFGNAIVEALACGVPVVATDAPHGPREILRDGTLGALVPLDDLGALVDAMDAMLDRPPDPQILRARAADFTTERAVARYAELFVGLGMTPPSGPAVEAAP